MILLRLKTTCHGEKRSWIYVKFYEHDMDETNFVSKYETKRNSYAEVICWFAIHFVQKYMHIM